MRNLKESLEDSLLARGDELAQEHFPQLHNISAAFIYRFVLTSKTYLMPEFLYVPHKETSGGIDPEFAVNLTQWNVFWEAGHLRREFFEEKDTKGWNRLLNRLKGHNVYLLSGNPNLKYKVYAPLYHLLPRRTLQYFGLPCFKKGIWPFKGINYGHNEFLPKDFASVFSRAFAHHIWPLIDSGSSLNAFSKSDSLYLLAHNLDYWLPYIYQVAENRLRPHDRVECKNEEQLKMLNDGRKKMPSDAEMNRPLCGGPIWYGENEAWEATREMINLADQNGRLREIIDAVRSHRIKDDFSSRWSFAKEDFERKLYRKRSKIKVTFVELEDTIPVHGPESEVHENILWEDFLGLLNEKEKRIVVCLRSGTTRLADIAQELGYANHSPISKALNRIRQKALKMLS